MNTELKIQSITYDLQYFFTDKGIVKISLDENENILEYNSQNLKLGLDILKENLQVKFDMGLISENDYIYSARKFLYESMNVGNIKNQISLIEDLPLSNNKKKSIISLISNYDLVQSIKFDDTFQLSPPYELTKIFGIGPWTVQMFSIFHLGISNILPIGDLGFINAYKKYYKDESLKKLNKNSNKWSKYTTIVTWYLWSSYDSEPLYL